MTPHFIAEFNRGECVTKVHGAWRLLYSSLRYMAVVASNRIEFADGSVVMLHGEYWAIARHGTEAELFMNDVRIADAFTRYR